MQNTNTGKELAGQKEMFDRGDNPASPNMKNTRNTGVKPVGTAYLRGHKSKVVTGNQG